MTRQPLILLLDYLLRNVFKVLEFRKYSIGVIIECSICGKEVERLNKALVEGSVIEVCDNCLKFGKKIADTIAYKPITRKIELKEQEEELVSDYGKLIAKIRKAKGMTREEFAKRISEKESVIRRVEEEQMALDKELIRKIENFLGIKLTEKYKERKKYSEEKKKGRLTVGDVVEIR